MSFLNKVVLITGAGSGIGEATAVKFAKGSAKLALVDLRHETVQKTAENCEKISGQKVIPIVADVAKKEDVERIVATTLKEFGRIDVLVQCAGILGTGGGVTDSNIMEIFDKVMSINLRALVELTHVAAPALIQSKGNIVFVSSENALKARINFSYAVSKAAVSHFTRCAALDLATKGVRVNSIMPGPIFTTNIGLYAGLDEEGMESFRRLVENCPLKNKVETHDVAEMIYFLAGDTAKAITGVNYAIDAGSLLLN